MNSENIDSRQKIAQITWINYYNFGTFLQAYALQKALKKLGYYTSIIDDRNFNFHLKQKETTLIKIKSLIKRIIGWNKGEIKRKRLYQTFAKRYLTIDSSNKSLTEIADNYKIYICGSDQIWSPILPSQSNGYFFASFAKENSIKISYASSFGAISCDNDYKELVTPWLDSFKSLSSREQSGVKILTEITGREDIVEVVDPTLLLNSDEWDQLYNDADCVQSSKPYMLCYFLSFNKEYIERCKEYAKEMNLQLMCFNNLDSINMFFDTLIDAGPSQFLAAIANCSYFATDSFHGTIFALQFKRQFVTFKRFMESDPKNQNSRIINLLGKVGLGNRFIGNTAISSMPDIYNWDNIDDAIQKYRSSSISYLKRALNDI